MRALELKLPPLALAIAVAAAMLVISREIPSMYFEFRGRAMLAVILAMLGVLVAALGIAEFRRHHTTVDPTNPTRSSFIVTTGIYRLSRNPMYVGFALMLAGLALHLHNWLGLVLVCAFVAYLHEFQVKPEERALLARFGEQFADYMRSVRRWI